MCETEYDRIIAQATRKVDDRIERRQVGRLYAAEARATKAEARESRYRTALTTIRDDYNEYTAVREIARTALEARDGQTG